MKKKIISALLLAGLYSGFTGMAIAAPSQTASFTIHWTDNSGNGTANDQEDGFNVERGPTATGTFTQVGTVGQNIVTYIDTIANDPGSTQYCYRVRAFNKAGNSGYSNVACATTAAIPQVPPTNPTTLTCTATITQGTQTLTLNCQ